jgi:Uma2 family endonuclease
MVKHIDDEVAYYYDSHPTEEDLMGETSYHSALVDYLMDVLRWLFHDRVCAIYENLNFYYTSNTREKPLVSDIAVITDVAYRHVRSWRIGKSGPTPRIVFEIASEETWQKDVNEKPLKYAHIGVEEYIFYDPHEPPLARATAQRLYVWRLDKDREMMVPIQPESGGRIWSPALESWLAPDGTYLRMYDRFGNLRLTQAEAEKQHAAIERHRAEAEARNAAIERQRAEKLAEMLRSMGVDPDRL